MRALTGFAVMMVEAPKVQYSRLGLDKRRYQCLPDPARIGQMRFAPNSINDR